jgi:hypothetical protein
VLADMVSADMVSTEARTEPGALPITRFPITKP